jgi:hypothetical protein
MFVVFFFLIYPTLEGGWGRKVKQIKLYNYMHGLSLVPATTVATFEEWIVWVQHKFQIYGKTTNTFLILNSRIFIQWQSIKRTN